MTNRLLIIQNSPTAPLGVLNQSICDRDISVEILTPLAGERLPISTAYNGLIILGGPMNAEDDAQYPHLMDVVRLVQLFATEHKPILGICLGAQLIARAFGSRVYQHDVVELGFTPLRLIPTAIADDPLLKSVLPSDSETVHIMEWHFDTFDLPDQAKLLMTGDNCQNQAYRLDDNIYGFQCHFEVNRAILQGWLANGRDYLQSNHPNFPEQLANQADLYLSQSNLFCHKVIHAWLDLVKLQAYEMIE
ncbi:type 1 glutamine amidotransferase [Pleurocapsa sp. FMAR1]|uniref:type 1 glutamine amidotransferase n=1 Tax=Pleurocapsa sp. FMAR1 TaxID=3040204 RepID=UPI0029C8CD71|nr:type 1 glutamine amidotransferase [Pleurocapsa sp. FMAR1]